MTPRITAAMLVVVAVAGGAFAFGRPDRLRAGASGTGEGGPGAASATDTATRPAIDAAALAYTYGVGAFRPEYTPPPAGSYALPVVDDLTDHPLLGSDGSATSLFAAKRGRAAVVAFVYATCAEAAGCPLSMAVLSRLDGVIAADPALAARVALLTISFDPERDTPARLASMREAHRPRSDWRFLTAASERDLGAVLDDFGQPVAKLRWDDGTWTGFYRHVLKVFLVDAENRVRNVYSAGFLEPEVILNDLRTVLGVVVDQRRAAADGAAGKDEP